MHQNANSDDIENCKNCELATENQNNEFTLVTPALVAIPYFITNTHEPSVFYNLVLSSSFLHSIFFGRPPPQVG